MSEIDGGYGTGGNKTDENTISASRVFAQPVCASGERTNMVVICSDGSAWQLVVFSGGASWAKLPPIPGTQAAAQ